jgi:hypothetical protein
VLDAVGEPEAQRGSGSCVVWKLKWE